MATTFSGRRGEAIAGINVTPMVDIMLVLLVIYIVASELGTQTVPVQLPQAQGQSASIGSAKPLRVRLTREGTFWLGGSPTTQSELRNQLRGHRGPVELAADKEVSHGEVVKLMQLLRDLGITDLQFAVAQGAQPS